MFLIELTYKKPLDIVDQFLAEHRAYLDSCYEKNYLIVSGPKNPRTGGFILSHLQDKNLLQQIIEQDPYYINGIAEYKITEFMPVKYHQNFAFFINQ